MAHRILKPISLQKNNARVLYKHVIQFQMKRIRAVFKLCFYDSSISIKTTNSLVILFIFSFHLTTRCGGVKEVNNCGLLL